MLFDLRKDGRTFYEHRPVESRLGLITSAPGSAFFQMGNTKIIAAVYDSKLCYRKKDQDLEKVTLKIRYGCIQNATNTLFTKRQRLNRVSRLISNTIKETFLLDILESLRIEVYVLILEENGGLYGACVNAIMLAVADFQLPCVDLTCCCSIGYLNNSLLLDPSDEECETNAFMAIHAYSRKIISIDVTRSNFGQSDMDTLWFLAFRSCDLISKFMRRSILERAIPGKMLLKSF
jgi:exosome complex component RRP41